MYRIMVVLKINTDIIASITVSAVGQAIILAIMYAETIKTDVIVFIGNVIKHFLTQYTMPIIQQFLIPFL